MWDPYAEFESATLPNGLTVHAAHWPGRPWQAVSFLIHSGAEHDPFGLEGVAHFVEHLVSENGSVSFNRMDAFFESKGGEAGFGKTGYPYTSYDFFAPANNVVLAEAFSMFGHMLLLAKLEKKIERERKVILAEFNRSYPIKFKFDLQMQMHKAVYHGTFLERFVTPLGTPQSINQTTKNDLQTYYDTHYTPANMSIVAVGGLKLDQLMELLASSPFVVAKEGCRTELPTPSSIVSVPLETRSVMNVSRYLTSEVPANICAYESIAIIPTVFPSAAVSLTCGVLSQLLNKEIRLKRAWAYSTDCSFHNFRNFFSVSINCGALHLEALDAVEDVVESCIALAKSRNDLLRKIQQERIAGGSMIDSTGRRIRDGATGDLAWHQRIISFREANENLSQVTIKDIREVLEWLRLERRWTRITRP